MHFNRRKTKVLLCSLQILLAVLIFAPAGGQAGADTVIDICRLYAKRGLRVGCALLPVPRTEHPACGGAVAVPDEGAKELRPWRVPGGAAYACSHHVLLRGEDFFQHTAFGIREGPVLFSDSSEPVHHGHGNLRLHVYRQQRRAKRAEVIT